MLYRVSILNMFIVMINHFALAKVWIFLYVMCQLLIPLFSNSLLILVHVHSIFEAFQKSLHFMISLRACVCSWLWHCMMKYVFLMHTYLMVKTYLFKVIRRVIVFLFINCWIIYAKDNKFNNHKVTSSIVFLLFTTNELTINKCFFLNEKGHQWIRNVIYLCNRPFYTPCNRWNNFKKKN